MAVLITGAAHVSRPALWYRHTCTPTLI